jgi:hypothetical protein
MDRKAEGNQGEASADENVPMPIPDWDKWRQMAQAPLDAWLALSVGICPDAFEIGHATLPKRTQDEYFKRWEIAYSHVDAGQLPAKVVTPSPGTQDCIVKLVDFVAWAEHMNWPLPESFPRPSLTAQRSRNAGQTEEVRNESDDGKRAAEDKPLATKERDVLLRIILGLAQDKGIKLGDPWSAAGTIVQLAEKAGHRVSQKTVFNHLKRAESLVENLKR